VTMVMPASRCELLDAETACVSVHYLLAALFHRFNVSSHAVECMEPQRVIDTELSEVLPGEIPGNAALELEDSQLRMNKEKQQMADQCCVIDSVVYFWRYQT